MLPPVILSEAILHQARCWRDECLQCWTADENVGLIGDANIISGEDNNPRKVRLLLGGGFSVKGKTYPGIFSPAGEKIGEGYTIALNKWLIDPRESWLYVLLHELTHTVDPCFDEDIERQKAEGPLADSLALYRLPSEQRAFTAMWTEDLRQELVGGTYQSPVTSIFMFRQRSVEFRGFWDHRNDLIERQTREHIKNIVEGLRRR